MPFYKVDIYVTVELPWILLRAESGHILNNYILTIKSFLSLVVFNQGEEGTSWYIILKGSVNVVIYGKVIFQKLFYMIVIIEIVRVNFEGVQFNLEKNCLVWQNK